MSETIYPKGFYTYKPREKAPEFVLGTVIITIDEFKNFINSNQQYLTEYNGKKQIRLNILKSQDGRVNFTVDTYKPERKQHPDPKPIEQIQPSIGDDNDLPF